MAAYVIVDYYEMLDKNLYEEYSQVGAPTVYAHGGSGLAGSDDIETLEGEWKPKRLVLLEFPNAARAREWFASPEYRKVGILRKKAARCNIVLVEGN